MTSRLLVNMPTAIETSEIGTKHLTTAKAQMHPNALNSFRTRQHVSAVVASWLHRWLMLWGSFDPIDPQPLSRFWSISWECSAVKGINMHWQSCFGETKPSYCHANPSTWPVKSHVPKQVEVWSRLWSCGEFWKWLSSTTQPNKKLKFITQVNDTRHPAVINSITTASGNGWLLFHYRPPAAPLEPRRCFCQSLGWAINMIYYYWSIACNMIWLI